MKFVQMEGVQTHNSKMGVHLGTQILLLLLFPGKSAGSSGSNVLTSFQITASSSESSEQTQILKTDDIQSLTITNLRSQVFEPFSSDFEAMTSTPVQAALTSIASASSILYNSSQTAVTNSTSVHQNTRKHLHDHDEETGGLVFVYILLVLTACCALLMILHIGTVIVTSRRLKR